MSPDPITKRQPRKRVPVEDLKSRRIRGEIACAECKRSKLKCDRNVPCSTCQRRGCESICPNGSFDWPINVNREYEAPCEASWKEKRITELILRVQELEEALTIAHALVSNQTHPLLDADLVSMKNATTSSENVDEETAETIDALGTLTISDTGNAKYFGRSSGSEALFFVSESAATQDDEANEPMCPISEPDILRLTNSFPLNESGSWETGNALQLLYSKLPEQPRAWTLVETFLQHSAATFNPMTRDEIIGDVLTPVYKLAKMKDGYLKVDDVSPHKLAVLFMILCLGALMDLTIAPDGLEADAYLYCGKAALSLRPVFDSPEISTIQAISYLAFYYIISSKRYSTDTAWSLLSMAVNLALAMGLHRDPQPWNLDEKIIQRRRFIFWEIYGCHTSWSFITGRLPAIRVSHIDCKFPEVDPLKTHEKAEAQIFRKWKWEYNRDITSLVIDDCLSAKSPPYKTILTWDRKIREKEVPPQLMNYPVELDPTKPFIDVMRGSKCNWLKALNLLYLHRPFFVQAMLDNPADPLQSAYAPSFVATYNCASMLMKVIIARFKHSPELYFRWANITWSHLFSSSAIAAMIVSRYPSSVMARMALFELNQVVHLFQQYAPDVPRARSGLMLLNTLQAKAQESFSKHLTKDPTRPLSTNNDEIAIYGGQTRLLISERWKQQVKARKPRQVPVPTATSTSTLTDSFSSPSQGRISSMMPPPSTVLQSEWVVGMHSNEPISLPLVHVPVDFVNVPVPSDMFERTSDFSILEDPVLSQDWLCNLGNDSIAANDDFNQDVFTSGFTTTPENPYSTAQPSMAEWPEQMETDEWMGLMRDTGFLDLPR